jgi:2-methylcitrate dehydratase PrpD
MLYEPLAQKQNPATAIDAKFSLPFTIASALQYGKVTLSSYLPHALEDAAVLDLARRFTFEISTDDKDSDNATRGKLTLTTRSGASYTASVEHPLGHSSRPMSESALIAKFDECAQLARHAMPVQQREHLVSAVLTLEEHRSLNDKFFSLLRP